LLLVYGEDLRPYEKILKQMNVPYTEKIQFLTEAEHVHTSRGEYIEQAESLKLILGMDEEFD
ncbi:MAG: hypothetical protein ACRC2T_02835, partial [Thermoguttaceae bacterium]